MIVYWTRTAKKHLRAIHDYIAVDSAKAAMDFVERILDRSEQIGQFPESGRAVPEYERPDIWEVFHRQYRVIYRIRTAQIDVLAVIHTARRLP